MHFLWFTIFLFKWKWWGVWWSYDVICLHSKQLIKLPDWEAHRFSNVIEMLAAWKTFSPISLWRKYLSKYSLQGPSTTTFQVLSLKRQYYSWKNNTKTFKCVQLDWIAEDSTTLNILSSRNENKHSCWQQENDLKKRSIKRLCYY